METRTLPGSTDSSKPNSSEIYGGFPDLKQLKHVMRNETGFTVKWYDIGLELLGSHAAILDVIKENNPNDVDKCCTEMFKEWLESKPNANWDQLIATLNTIGLNTAAENIIKYVDQAIESKSQTAVDTKKDLEVTEDQLRASRLATLKGKYTEICKKLQLIIQERKLDVNSLILKLCSHDEDNITVFFTDDAFKKIHNTTELFHHIGQYCSIYDCELLVAFVESTGCQEAIKLLDDFIETLSSSILIDLDLLHDIGELRDPKDFMPGTHKLIINYVGGNCTLKTKGLVHSTICEHFHLKKGSIIFKGVQEEDCVAFIYQISPAVKTYLLHHLVTTTSTFFTVNKIKCLLIDDEEVRTLQLPAKANSKDYKVNIYAERFNEDDVESSFFYLLNKLEVLWSKSDFSQLQKVCKRDTRFSNEQRISLKNTTTLDEVFDLLTNSPFCTWLEVRILKRMAKVAEIPEATHMINTFEECVHSRKCSDVISYLNKKYINPDHLSEIKAKLNDNIEHLIVADLIEYCHKLEGILQLPHESSAPANIKEGCLEIHFHILTYSYLHAYKSAKRNFWKFRPMHIRYLQIGMHPKVYTTSLCKTTEAQSLLAKLSSANNWSSPSEVINHYYMYLKGHMDADSVSHMMHYKCLVTDDDFKAITSVPNDDKMNLVLLQYVRSMDLSSLFKFTEILKSIETQENIGHHLELSLKAIMKVDSRRLSTASGISMDISVELEFLDLVDDLVMQMSTADVAVLVKQCGAMMASDIHEIPLFTPVFMSKLNNCIYPYIFKIYLLPFMNWFDYSILKELAKSSNYKEALKLVDLFVTTIDYNQPITTYPISEFSQLVMPLDNSEYTLLATRSIRSFNELTLQYLVDIKRLLVQRLEITNHAILLAGLHNLSYCIYWLIPNQIRTLVQDKLNQEQLELWDEGIVLTTLLPVNFFSDSNLHTQENIFHMCMMQHQVSVNFQELQDMMKQKQELKDSKLKPIEEISTTQTQLCLSKGEVEKLKRVAVKYQELKELTIRDENTKDEIEDENVATTVESSVTCSVAASVTATLSMSSAVPPTLIATTAAPPTTSVVLSTATFSSTTVSAAPPTLIADSSSTTSTTKSVVSEVSSLATSTSTATPIAESAAPPITEFAALPTTTSAVSNYADQNKPVVKGPAGIIQSHEEANNFYMKIHFPGWQEHYKTCIIPPVYEMNHEEKPNEIIFQNEKRQVSDDRLSQLAEESVVYAFYNYGCKHAQPMFIFHGVKLDKISQQQHGKKKNNSGESDIIIVHREIGIILVETKSMETFNKDTYRKAKDQLNDAEEFLKTIELGQHARRVPVLKVIACPKLRRNPSRKLSQYIDLRKEDLNEFDDWWKNAIESSSTNLSILQPCKTAYCSLIPKLVCGRDDICLPLKIRVIADKLDNQEVCKKVNEQEINVHYERENKGTLVEECIYLTPEQCTVWHKERQVICGPFGSGKTVLIQCKAAHLANDGESVLVIVPLHLIPGYKKFFEETVKKDSKLQLISRVELHRHFDTYKTLAQSSHVFVDELLWPYSPDEFPESEDKHEGDRRKFHVFELLQILMNKTNPNNYYAWIAPHLFALVTLSFPKYSNNVIEGMSAVFLPGCIHERFPISRLTNIMRTSKQINDVQVIEEQHRLDQGLFKIAGNYLYNFTTSFLANCPARLSLSPSLSDGSQNDFYSYYSNIIQPLLRNTLGHCVSGPPVKTITYPTHCCNYDVHDKLPNETSKEHLHQFFAKALKAELEVLLREPPELKESTKRNPLQPSDIVIIKDFQDDNLNLDHGTHNIKTLLHDAGVKTCTVTEQQGGTNEVAICHSYDVASLEWPVVFHVSSTPQSSSSIDRYIYGEGLIISRAKVQYILLCVSKDYYHDPFLSLMDLVGRLDIVKK